MTEFSRRNAIIGLSAAAGLTACGGLGSGSGQRRLGVALVGVGDVTTRDIIPALRSSDRCSLTGFVSSSDDKLQALGAEFDVPSSGLYTYDNFDRIAENPAIDFVYIALPNALHAEYTIRAARAGKHVLCEKPLAVSVEQCEAMIAACAEARRSLAVAYRLHHSAHHRALLRSLKASKLGRLQVVRADIGYPLGDEGGWRLDRSLAGGGVLLEQGVYAVHAARMMAGADPVEVLGYEAKSDAKKFAEVDETVSWTMRFPNDVVAHCASSYTMPANHIWAGGAEGWYELDDAFSTNRIRARTSSGDVDIDQVNQFVLQLDGFARSIQENRPVDVGISGEDGLRDARIMSAIYESIRTRDVVQVRKT